MKKFGVIFLILTVFLVTSFQISAHGPTRQQAKESITINAPVETVWQWISDFYGIDKWHPAVTEVKKSADNVRILTVNNGPTVTEKLVKVDNNKMRIKYKIIDMSTVKTIEFAGSTVEYKTLPVANYSSFITVSKEGKGSKVTWVGKFYRGYQLNPPTPEGLSDKDAVKTMKAVYKAGLDNLKKILERQP